MNISHTAHYTYGDIVYAGDGALNAFMLSNGNPAGVTVAGSAITIEASSVDSIEGYIFANETDNHAPAWWYYSYSSGGQTPQPTPTDPIVVPATPD